MSLTNLGMGVSRGKTFPGRGTSIPATTQLTFDDTFWFSGSIYSYDFNCRNCKDRIAFAPKIALESKEELPFTS